MTNGAFPEEDGIVLAQKTGRAGEKARIHNGAVAGKQPVPAVPPDGIEGS
jgi:hypothetical protein